MPVHEIKRVLVQELGSRHVTQITGNPGRIRWHEDIRHDTATTIHGTPAHGLVFQILVKNNTIFL